MRVKHSGSTAVPPVFAPLAAGLMAATMLSMLVIGGVATERGTALLERLLSFPAPAQDPERHLTFETTVRRPGLKEVPARTAGDASRPAAQLPRIRDEKARGPVAPARSALKPTSETAVQREMPESEFKTRATGNAPVPALKPIAAVDVPRPLRKPAPRGDSEPWARPVHRAVAEAYPGASDRSATVYAGQSVLSTDALKGLRAGLVSVNGLEFSFAVTSVLEIGDTRPRIVNGAGNLGAQKESAAGEAAGSTLGRVAEVGNAIVQVGDRRGDLEGVLAEQGERVRDGIRSNTPAARNEDESGAGSAADALKLVTELTPDGTGSAQLAFGEDGAILRDRDGKVEVLSGDGTVKPLNNGSKVEFPAGSEGEVHSATVENAEDGGFALRFEDGSESGLVGEVLQSEAKLEQRIGDEDAPLVRGSFSPARAASLIGNGLNETSINSRAEVDIIVHNFQEIFGNPAGKMRNHIGRTVRRDAGVFGSGGIGR